MKWFALIWVIALIALHQDFWLWTNKTLIFGFLPIGLVYHALFAVAASFTMWMLVKVAWPKHLDEDAGEVAVSGKAAAVGEAGKQGGNP